MFFRPSLGRKSFLFRSLQERKANRYHFRSPQERKSLLFRSP